MVPSIKRIFRHWKRIYLVCCLVYVGWVIHAGWPEFLKVNHQYQVLAGRLEPDRIRAIALEELAAECRRGLRQQNIPDDGACSGWSSALVKAKSDEVAERLERARKRGLIKVVLFYSSVVVIFLLFPSLFLYVLVLGVVTLSKNIRIVRR